MEPEKIDPPTIHRPVDTNEHQSIKLTEPFPPAKNKKYPLVIGIVVLIIVLGISAYVVGAKKPVTKTTPATSQTPSEQTVTEKDVPDSTETKAYENGFLGVKLTYPSNWTATESDNKDSVKLESPGFSYLTVSKGSVTGNFRIYIRKGARTQDGKYIGRGYAIAPSEKLTYSQPAMGQRTETYLTLFGLDTPDNFGFFLIAGNYNLAKSDTLGPDYGKEPETYIISGGFSQQDFTDDLQTNAVSVDLAKASNAYKQAIEILKTLQLR